MNRRAVVLVLAVSVGAPACGEKSAPGAPVENPCAQTLPYPEPTQTGDTRDVHDPEIVQVGNVFYVLSTNDGIPIRRSTDLLSWTFVGRVFPQQLPSWARSAVPGVVAPWAPGVAFFEGTYHLYYSLSTFGSPRSVIGLATNATLDPTSPAYAWQDRGKVVESFSGYDYNAIDPAVVEDARGGLWLTWGSWGGGIKLRALDRSTGLFSEADGTTYSLARRPLEKSIEGPYIVRRGGYFYLFASFDNCCQGTASTYNVRVGRSANVTGPYVDADGVDMLVGGGTPVLTGYGRAQGPGHASVLVRGDEYLLVHHFYDAADNGTPNLQVRPLIWDADGWPVAGEPYDGSLAGPPPATPDLTGHWAYWAGNDAARDVELRAGGVAVACDRQGHWSWSAPTLTVQWDAIAQAGARTDRLTLTAGAATLAGRSSDHRIVRAYRRR